MWEMKHKEGWAPNAWCFWTAVLEKTLESPLDGKEIQPVHPKGNPSWIFIGRTGCWSWNSSTLATWCEELTDWKRPWYWGRLRVAGERGDRGWDEMVGWHHWLNGREVSLSKLWEIVKDREAWCAAVHGVPKSWTWLSDWTPTSSLSLSPYPSSVPPHKLNPPNIP